MKLTYTVQDLYKVSDLVDEAWDKLREARMANGTMSVAWTYRIDISGIMADLEKLSNALVDTINEVLPEENGNE